MALTLAAATAAKLPTEFNLGRRPVDSTGARLPWKPGSLAFLNATICRVFPASSVVKARIGFESHNPTLFTKS